jgi:DNA-binding CsgD family transcriptional regulator
MMLPSQLLEVTADGTQISLEAINCAAIVLSNRLQVVSLNQLAKKLLSENTHLRDVAGLLKAQGKDQTNFAKVIERVQRTSTIESLRLYDVGTKTEAYVNITKLRQQAGSKAIEFANLLVQIERPSQIQIASESQLIQLFKLSPAEARLARALTKGINVGKYAVENQIKLSTVRSQVASIHFKVGVQKQTDLIRAILSVPRLPE